MARTLPMKHELRLTRVEGAEPTTSSVQLRDRDPTPMLSETPRSESIAVSKLNDGKWLDGHPVVEKVINHLRQKAGPTKSWFKASHVADAIGEAPQSVGPAMAALYRADECAIVAERRQSGDVWVYRVEVGQ